MFAARHATCDYMPARKLDMGLYLLYTHGLSVGGGVAVRLIHTHTHVYTHYNL